MKKLLLFMICIFLLGCSKYGGSRRVFDAYNRGDYKEAISHANRVMDKYEYSDEEKANLLYVKVESYAKLKEYASAFGVVSYIIKKFPDTEAGHKSKILLATVIRKLKEQKEENVGF